MKSLKELKQMGLCLTREEQLSIKGKAGELSYELGDVGEQSYYRDTVNPSDCERCARRTFPDGSTDEWHCITVHQ